MVYLSLITGCLPVLVKTFCSHALKYQNCHRMLNGWKIVIFFGKWWHTNISTNFYIQVFNTFTKYCFCNTCTFFIIKAWKCTEETCLKRRWNKIWMCQISCNFLLFTIYWILNAFKLLSTNSITFLSELSFFCLLVLLALSL